MNEAIENQWEKKLISLAEKLHNREAKLTGMMEIWGRQLAELDSQDRQNESLFYDTEMDLIVVNSRINHLEKKFKSWGTDLSSLKPVRSTKDKWILTGEICLATIIYGVSALMYVLSGNPTSKIDNLLEEDNNDGSLIDVEFTSSDTNFPGYYRRCDR